MDIRPVTLEGKIIRLEPLAESHCQDLIAVGNDERIWRYSVHGKVQTFEDMLAWIQKMLRFQAAGTDLPFAVIHLQAGKAIGVTRFSFIEPPHRHLEIGGTWYGVEYQGSGVNTEAKYLMLRHAFEYLGCIRVQLKTDARNLHSQRAIERLGAVKEGVLRQHMINPDGYRRDSVYYSILDLEWPAIKQRLESQLQEIYAKTA